MLSVECFIIFSSSTLYGVTKPVTEVTKLVTHEESLTLLRRELRRAGPPSSEKQKAEMEISRGERGDAENRNGGEAWDRAGMWIDYEDEDDWDIGTRRRIVRLMDYIEESSRQGRKGRKEKRKLGGQRSSRLRSRKQMPMGRDL